MRFDDRLHTASGMGDREAASVESRWRHLVDLLAQSNGLSGDARERTLDEARRITPAIAPSIKRSAALAIAARVRSADLVALFSAEPPRIAAPVLLGALLSEREWQELIPQLSPPLRALLRERRDLPQRARDGLAAFGPSDFTLSDDRDPIFREAEPAASPFGATEKVEQQSGVSRISDLVAKIETWRSRRDVSDLPDARSDHATKMAEIDKFQFEADDDGLIVWVYGAPPASIIGISLAALADPVCPGVDGQTAGAFAKRADIRDGRMMLAAETPLGGLWSIEARALFQSDTGKFRGYAGISRRASDRIGATASAPASQPEVLRQIVHELRSPLNAVRGFAELIEHQIAGPVGRSYRTRATSIVGEAVQMLKVIETLDVAAKAVAIDADPVISHSARPQTVRASA